MISLLLVEDDPRKAQRIREVLTALSGIHDEAIAVAPDIVTAKRRLQTEQFDVLLLDLMLPVRFGDKANSDGGARLLAELVSSSTLKRPTFIVGITAYDEVAESNAALFASHLFGLVRYEESSTAWQNALGNLLGHALATADRARHSGGVDLVVLCALEDPELRSVLRLGHTWSHFAVQHDSAIYYEATIGRDGKMKRVIAVASPQMGMPAAAALSMKAICKFAPRYIVMCGIAAGAGEGLHEGDVVVADPSWDYGSGKIVRKPDGLSQFLPEPTQIALDPLTKAQFKRVAVDVEFLARVRDSWVGLTPGSALSVRFGPVGSGAAVLAAEGTTTSIKEHHRKLLAVDMETYGVYLASTHAPYPRPIWVSAKGISDFADMNKDDKWRPYAAYTSAAIVLEWAQRFL